MTLRCKVGRGSLDKNFERVPADTHFWPRCGCVLLNIFTLHLSAWRPCKNIRSGITFSGVPFHWQPQWAPGQPAAKSGKRQGNPTVTLTLEGKWDFDSVICSYSGMNSERGTVGYLIKKVVKYRLWKNLVFMKQNESQNPVLLTLPPEITELYWDTSLATAKSREEK